jgi:hypothetical protein
MRPGEKGALQRDFLSLLNLGDGTALGTKKGLSFQGRWVMKRKDWIDRRSMERSQVDPRSACLSEAGHRGSVFSE